MSPPPKSNRHNDEWNQCRHICLRDIASTKLAQNGRANVWIVNL